MSKVTTPEPGRHVHYWPGGRMEKEGGAQPRAAIIVYVHGPSMVNLTTFDPNGFVGQTTSVKLVGVGETPPATGPFCEWMPYHKDKVAAEVAGG